MATLASLTSTKVSMAESMKLCSPICLGLPQWTDCCGENSKGPQEENTRRFKHIDEQEAEELSHGFTPTNTAKNTKWALFNFQEWTVYVTLLNSDVESQTALYSPITKQFSSSFNKSDIPLDSFEVFHQPLWLVIVSYFIVTFLLCFGNCCSNTSCVFPRQQGNQSYQLVPVQLNIFGLLPPLLWPGHNHYTGRICATTSGSHYFVQLGTVV